MALYDTSNELQRIQFLTRAAKLAESSKIVELTERKPRRTSSQNKYLHTILGYFAIETGNSLERVKQQYFKRLVNSDIFIAEVDDQYLGRIKVVRSSADLTTDEMTTCITKFRNWSSAEAGIYLPSSDEERLVQLMEIECQRNREYI